MSPWCRWASRLGGQRESSRGSPRSAGGTDQVSKGERKAEKEDAELESFLEDLEWPPPSVPAGDGDEGVFYVAAVLSGHTQGKTQTARRLLLQHTSTRCIQAN